MTEVKSVRIPENLIATIRDRARREQLDESTTIRQLISRGIREYACELYRDGEVTLREATKIADLPLREGIEILEACGIEGNVTFSQQRDAVRNALDAADESA